MTKRAKGNIDSIQGIILPSQSYALSGRQWGTSQEESNSKRSTDASPMVITSQPPGAFADTDLQWKLTFGSSQDGWLTLFNSQFMQNDEPTLSDDVWGKGFLRAPDFNLFKLSNNIQQIAYLANKDTVEEFRNNPKATNEFEVRGLGVRLPMMAAGWGKTVALRPTDPEPSDKRKNDEEHKLARETWKHGPVDFRWDERKGMWTSFNDLITGQHKDELGTLVFSSNPDETAGFPFLKGKLQDVWSVRKTLPYDGTVGDDDEFLQTGEICTILEHKWLDESTNTVAKLNSIFTIPGTNHAPCHLDPNGPTTCGSEDTYDGSVIDILTTAHFNMTGTQKDGPINFSAVDLDSNQFCNIDTGFYHQGIIYFNEDSCGWDVAVRIDECELAGGHFATLAQNDVYIMERLTYICNTITGWAGGKNAIYPPGGAFSAPEVHDINMGTISASILCLDSNIRLSFNSAVSRMSLLDGLVYTASTNFSRSLYADLVDVINAWIADTLSPVLIACCGEIGGQIGGIQPEAPTAGPAPVAVVVPPEYLDCTPILEPMPRLNCEYCFGLHILVPCGEEPEVFAGDACFSNDPPLVSSPFGSCQTHLD